MLSGPVHPTRLRPMLGIRREANFQWIQHLACLDLKYFSIQQRTLPAYGCSGYKNINKGYFIVIIKRVQNRKLKVNFLGFKEYIAKRF